MGQTALRCPRCTTDPLVLQNGVLTCGRCGHEIAERDGVYDFAPNAGDTQLDTDDYTNAHFPDDAAYRNLATELERVLDKVLPADALGHVLEIGSGSGAWTWGLSRAERVKTLYATDISPGFLSHLHKSSSGPGTLLLRAGAEDLRFEPESLDLVLGRSVLHHIYDYPSLLKQVRSWLKPGGTALFFEPCLQGKLWVAFYLELVRQLDGATGLLERAGPLARLASRGKKTLADPKLSPAARQRLGSTMRHILKEYYLPNIDDAREGLEDKYVFDIETLLEQAREAGFTSAEYLDQDQSNGLALTRICNAVASALGPESGKLDSFAPAFEAFAATFGKHTETAPVAPMVYFVFRT